MGLVYFHNRENVPSASGTKGFLRYDKTSALK